LNRTYEKKIIEKYLGRKGRDENHCILVKHGALKEMQKIYFDFYKALFS